MEKQTLTVKECADYLGISTWLIYEQVKSGSIPHIRIGRRLLFRKDSLNAWMGEIEEENQLQSIVEKSLAYGKLRKLKR